MNTQNENENDGSNYWVLSTDYKNYTVVWCCRDIPEGGSVQFAWILTRDRTPSEDVVRKAYDVLDRNELSRKPLQKAIQAECDDIKKT